MPSVFLAGEEQNRHSFARESIFMRVSADAGDSARDFPIFLDEGGNEAAKTHINVDRDIPLAAVGCDGVDGVAGAVGVVGV